MEDSEKLRHLSMEDLESVAGGVNLSATLRARLPKMGPDRTCPFCGMKFGSTFDGAHTRFSFDDATVWECGDDLFLE